MGLWEHVERNRRVGRFDIFFFFFFFFIVLAERLHSTVFLIVCSRSSALRLLWRLSSSSQRPYEGGRGLQGISCRGHDFHSWIAATWRRIVINWHASDGGRFAFAGSFLGALDNTFCGIFGWIRVVYYCGKAGP
jgi:hypothetical protein